MSDLPTCSIINAVIKDYKKNAAKKSLEWALSREEFIDIASRQCAYCGQKAAVREFNRWYRDPKRKRWQSIEKLNGIDRIDSSLGYVIGNCAPCCKKCNIVKWDMRLEDFMAHIVKIYRYMGLG